MARTFTRWYSALLSALLTLLGFSSCGGDEPVEYGSPSVDFTVKGTVTDQDSNPLQGIKVSTVSTRYGEYVDTVASTLTDANGQYELPKVNDVAIDYGNTLVAEDIDGEANGGDHATVTTQFKDLPRTQTAKGYGNWYDGEYVVTGDIRMNKK